MAAAAPLSGSQAQEAIRAGMAALRQGDARRARALIEQAAASPAIVPPWLLLAQACRADRDFAAEERALDAALALQPRQVLALVMKGDCRARHGDDRAAVSFYQTALTAAATADPAPPPAALAQAERFLADFARRNEAALVDTLAKAGVDPATAPPRFRDAFEMLCGRATPYPQQPTSFFYPGLPAIEFFDPADFAWAAALEAAAPAIRAEYETAMAAGDAGLVPYVEAEPGRPRPRHLLLDDPCWSALHLRRQGEPTPAAARFPATMAALDRAPLPRIAGRAPMALISVLRPGTHIAPHNGMLNTRLICHLPLIVPPGCRFRVGNRTRPWEEGKLLIFDDSIEHEAWNDGPATRAILLFEIWRPDLAPAELAALTALFEAVSLPSEGVGEG